MRNALILVKNCFYFDYVSRIKNYKESNALRGTLHI